MKIKWKLTKEQLLSIGAGILLAVLSLLTGSEELLQRDGSSVYTQRPGYGEAETSLDVQVKSAEGEEENVNIRISSRKYTPEEAQALFEEMDEAVLDAMLGENVNQLEIRTDLQFPSSLEAYPGVSLSWSSDSASLVSRNGTVNNTELKEAQDAKIRLQFTASGESCQVEFPIRVLPAPERAEKPDWKERLEQMLWETDERTGTEKNLVLPEEFEGAALSYSTPKDRTYLLFPALGLLCAVLLGLKPKEEEKKRKKEREAQLMIDYSEIISKLIVYIGAGLTVRNAFHQLAESYREQKGPVRAVYEEILAADQELINGEPESAVYMRFGRRCGLKCYIRMVSLLEQNRKTGDSSLLNSLELEMGEAFEQRKNVARRLGEEAGTKMMGPLMISLITVLLIVIIPALSQMG